MPLTEILLQILLFAGIAVLAIGTAAAVTLWLVIRKLRRSRRLRRGLRLGTLTVRSFTKDDAGRRLARHRLALHRSADATERALAAARSEGRPVGELPLTAARLAAATRSLDEQLKVAEGEPDLGLKRSLAATLAGRAEHLNRLSGELRQSLLEAGYAADAGQLEVAGRHLAREVEALKAWSSAYRGAPGPQRAAAPPAGPVNILLQRLTSPQRRPDPSRS